MTTVEDINIQFCRDPLDPQSVLSESQMVDAISSYGEQRFVMSANLAMVQTNAHEYFKKSCHLLRIIGRAYGEEMDGRYPRLENVGANQRASTWASWEDKEIIAYAKKLADRMLLGLAYLADKQCRSGSPFIPSPSIWTSVRDESRFSANSRSATHIMIRETGLSVREVFSYTPRTWE